VVPTPTTEVIEPIVLEEEVVVEQEFESAPEEKSVNIYGTIYYDDENDDRYDGDM